MKAQKSKKPSPRSESRIAHAPKSTAPSEEESEFLASAWAMEVEAVERYSMLADAMEEHNNLVVAELFRKLARIEQLHADGIMDQNPSLQPQQALATGKFSWNAGEGPETADPGELHYRMQPYHALQMALVSEHRAHQFFMKFARAATSASVRKQALEMAAEEAEHVRLIEDWIRRTPRPEENWAYDPDPPASAD
jgi:rubrerythrin